jgi:hypothetical protein
MDRRDAELRPTDPLMSTFIKRVWQMAGWRLSGRTLDHTADRVDGSAEIR